MSFLIGSKLDKAIRQVLASPNPRCVIAFLGRGSCKLFKHGSAKVVLNLSSGATNPHEVRKLMAAGHEVRQEDRLHAKVYLAAHIAVVGSANLSSNGLGLEESEQAHWIEAGYQVTDVRPLARWFNQIWKDSREITDDDLENAELQWKRRRSHKPTLASFAHFDPEQENLPQLSWWANVDAPAIVPGVFEKEVHFTQAEAEKSVAENSMYIYEIEDRAYTQPGTWLLQWKKTNRGTMASRSQPTWFRCGTLVPRSVTFDDYDHPWDVVLEDQSETPKPFDVEDPAFVSHLRELLADSRYQLITEGLDSRYFGLDQDMLRRFWRELKAKYMAASKLII